MNKKSTHDGHGGYKNFISVPKSTGLTLDISNVPIDNYSNSENSNTKTSGTGTWGPLKRISIPTFTGIVREYENWISIFRACIDSVSVPEEYKLLQLCQYLSGDVLTVADGLGHSKSAYSVAFDRLERKYGGERRNFSLYLEEVEKFRTVSLNNSDDLEKFADMLDILVLKLQDSIKNEEIGGGLLCIVLSHNKSYQ